MAIMTSPQHTQSGGPVVQTEHHDKKFVDAGLAGSQVPKKILDIRQARKEISLLHEIHQGLEAPDDAEKRLPTLLLYDEKGLKLFEDITYLDEYYPTNAEIDALSRHANDIAKVIPQDSVIVELGSGNLRKIDILLRALDNAGKNIEYYALDLSLPELERTLSAIPEGAYKHVRCFGLLGTYDDGLEWLTTSDIKQKKRTVLSLGSSIGNFSRTDAAGFLKGFADALGPDDKMLLGIDACQDAERVHRAYNDSQGITHEFVLNGLAQANTILGKAAFNIDDWRVIGEYNVEAGRHQAFVSPIRDVTVEGVHVRAGEKVRFEESHKYSARQASELWLAAGLCKLAQWSNASGDYAMHLIAKPKYSLPWLPEQYAATPAPTWEEWRHLWSLWDEVTRHMIPETELNEKPIKLRNACIFYLGHIPAFFDIKMKETWPERPATDPAYYHQIFERGIDPDVDNPEQCHDHSEIPDSWPPLNEMLAYQQRVRDRVQSVYDSGEIETMKAARVMWLGYEHESMHLETLLYMLIQSDNTLPPSSTPEPIFSVLADQGRHDAVSNEWFTIPSHEIVMGMDDPDTADGSKRFFGWDCEKPSRKVSVKAFEAKARPITIGEFAEYLSKTGKSQIPASWSMPSSTNGQTNGHSNGHANGDPQANGNVDSFLHGKTVRTVYGLVPLEYALSWPVAASYEELAGCASWMGGRIPTLEEAESLYHYVELQKEQGTVADGRTIPAVNGHLVNDGVQESPPRGASHADGDEKVAWVKLNPRELFVSLKGCNVGFQNWHPTPVTQNGGRLSGRGDLGGVWEWTSTPLTKHEGYSPMPLYPAYSQDFFDGKHNVVLGGSWATVPRIAGRKSFINWYQYNYQYAWCGARLVRDL